MSGNYQNSLWASCNYLLNPQQNFVVDLGGTKGGESGREATFHVRGTEYLRRVATLSPLESPAAFVSMLWSAGVCPRLIYPVVRPSSFLRSPLM